MEGSLGGVSAWASLGGSSLEDVDERVGHGRPEARSARSFPEHGRSMFGVGLEGVPTRSRAPVRTSKAVAGRVGADTWNTCRPTPSLAPPFSDKSSGWSNFRPVMDDPHM